MVSYSIRMIGDEGGGAEAITNVPADVLPIHPGDSFPKRFYLDSRPDGGSLLAITMDKDYAVKRVA